MASSIVRSQFGRLARPVPCAANRQLATLTTPAIGSARNHKVLVIGGGAAGSAISHQLLRKGNFSKDDIAVVDPSIWHHYQPGWTLVGGGLKSKEELRMPLAGIFDPQIKFYHNAVDSLKPEDNSVTFTNGETVNYEQLVVAPGVKVDTSTVTGLPEALNDANSLVSTIYLYDYCDKAFRTIESLKSGNAIFTQPAGVVKCAGAPQKIMWLALDYWKKAGLYNPSSPNDSAIKISFATGLPAMFGVPKYNAKLEQLRQERGVEGLFEHDLVSIDGDKATFARPGGKDKVTRQFDFLHVSPKNVPHAFIKKSKLANQAGYVDVDDATTQHKTYKNVWSAGDASSLPTSKTVAAITSQAPILVANLLKGMRGEQPDPAYDGYTSCPLLTEYGKVLLAEFKYGGVPKETFNELFGVDQIEPSRAFWHLKKDFFPVVYKNYHVQGRWGGPKGIIN